MKKILLLIVVSTMIWGLSADSLPPYETYSPILMERAELEKSIKSHDPTSLKNPGKIYIKDTLLFIVEKFQGIHVINDYDPSNPENVKFITIPGIVDVAIKGNVLYADNAVDLVSVDITDLDNVKEINRVKNVFPELYHPELRYIPNQFRAENRPENTIIVNWKKRGS